MTAAAATGHEPGKKIQKKNILAQNASYLFGIMKKNARSTITTSTIVGQDGKVRSNRMRQGGRDFLAAVLSLTLI